jgi:hypothetical protein
VDSGLGVATSTRHRSPGWDGGRNVPPPRPPSQSQVNFAPGLTARGEGRYHINPPSATDASMMAEYADMEQDPPPLASEFSRVKSFTSSQNRHISSAGGPRVPQQWWLRPTTASPRKGAAAVEAAGDDTRSLSVSETLKPSRVSQRRCSR